MAGNFCKVAYSDCGNEQVVFRKASSVVNCAVCETTLATPTDGGVEFHGEVVEMVERHNSDELEA